MFRNEGEKLDAVWYADQQAGYRVGYQGIVSITVIHVNGHMALQPWAKVVDDKGKVALLNLSQMEEVLLPQPETEEKP